MLVTLTELTIFFASPQCPAMAFIPGRLTFYFIPSPENPLVDALRTDSSEKESIVVGPANSAIPETHSIPLDDKDLLECFLTHPQFNEDNVVSTPLRSD